MKIHQILILLSITIASISCSKKADTVTEETVIVEGDLLGKWTIEKKLLYNKMHPMVILLMNIIAQLKMITMRSKPMEKEENIATNQIVKCMNMLHL